MEKAFQTERFSILHYVSKFNNEQEDIDIINTAQLPILGSLFDGIGGFPYAASFFGIQPLWASEILPSAISITRRHLPDMEHVGDITQMAKSRQKQGNSGTGGYYDHSGNRQCPHPYRRDFVHIGVKCYANAVR